MRIRYGVLLALLLGAVPALPADILYSVTDVGSIDGFDFDTEGRDINNAGQVTGGDYIFIPGHFHAFLYNNGVMRDLGTPRPDHPDDLTWGFSVNNLGQVTGDHSYSDVSNAQYHRAFLYSNGQMRDLGTLAGGCCSIGNGINDAGQVVGWADITPTENRIHAFLYQDGQMSDLGTLGGRSSEGTGINNAGQVTGHADTASGATHAFLYSDGRMVDLGTLPGGVSSYGLDINDTGQVVGWSYTSTGDTHAFLYSNGQMRDLGPGRADAINNLGQVVGQSAGAFLYSNGQMMDLNDLINPELGITLREARAISDDGQIVANGGSRAYLLTPIPEPSTWALFAVGVASVLTVPMCRRKKWLHHLRRTNKARHQNSRLELRP